MWTYALVEHVCLVPEGGVLAKMLSDHLHSLYLQPLQFLKKRNRYTKFTVKKTVGSKVRPHCYSRKQ